MALEDDISILRAAPFLSDIPTEGLRLLAFAAEPRNLKERDLLFRAGETATSSFVLVSGALSMVQGSRPPMLVTRPGTLIDELALFCDVTRLFTATADRPTRLLRLPRAAFIRMLEEYPVSTAQLRERLLAGLREDADTLARIGAEMDAIAFPAPRGR